MDKSIRIRLLGQGLVFLAGFFSWATFAQAVPLQAPQLLQDKDQLVVSWPLQSAAGHEVFSLGSDADYRAAGKSPVAALHKAQLRVGNHQGRVALQLWIPREGANGFVAIRHGRTVEWVDLTGLGTALPATLAKPAALGTLSLGEEWQSSPESREALPGQLRVLKAETDSALLPGRQVRLTYMLHVPDKNDPEGETKIEWYVGPDKLLVGQGRLFEVRPEDVGLPVYARILPASKSGKPGVPRVVYLGQVANGPLPAATVAREMRPAWSAQTLWLFQIRTSSGHVLAVNSTPSDRLDPMQLLDALNRHLAKGVNQDSLKATLESVDEMYRRAGVPQARAMLPPQNIQDPVISLLLLEPRIGSISVQQARSVEEARMVASRLGIVSGSALNVNDLDREATLFNERHRAQVRKLLAPGKAVGESDLVIEVTSPPAVEGAVNLSNLGAEETGRQLLSGRLTLNGLIYGHESIGLSAVKAEGLEVAGVTVDWPVNFERLNVGIGYTDIRSRQLIGQAAAADVRGNGSTAYVQVSHPILRAPGSSWDWALRLTRAKNGTAFLGQTIQIGSDASKRSLMTTFDKTVNRESGRGRLTLMGQYTDVNYAYANPFSGNSVENAGKLNLTANYTLELPNQWSLKANLESQPLRRLMPGAEYFVIGGDNNRAYRPGIHSGDYGGAASLELAYAHRVAASEGLAAMVLQPYVFVDQAWAKRLSNSASSGLERSDRYNSTGLGLRVRSGAGKVRLVTLDLYAAQPNDRAVPNRVRDTRYGLTMTLMY